MTVRLPILVLLAGTALSSQGFLAATALAQTADSQATSSKLDKNGTEEVRVTGTAGHRSADGVTGLQPGGGLIKMQTAPKSISTVSNDYIQKQAPATSPFMLVQLLPGAVVSEVDPWGLSGGGIALRGLDQTEMAFIWEGMPISDVGVYTTYPSEFADGENMSELTLQQGSSNIDTPTINGSGGLFTFQDRDPSEHMGGLFDYGYGSYKYNREFGRFDTGEIGNTGIRAFVSASYQHDRAWRGSGVDNKVHMDWKFLKEWGNGNRVSLVGAYQDAIQNSYTNPTLAQWGQFGRSFNYDGTYTYNDTNYWKLNRNPYRNFEMSAPSHFNLGRGLTADFTPYMWHGYGNGTIGLDVFNGVNFLGAQPVNLSVPGGDSEDGAPFLYAFIDDQYRSGFNSTLKYRSGINTVYAGWWFDYSNDHDYYTYSPVGQNGEPASVWGDLGILRTTDGTPFLGRNDDTKTTIHALYIGDQLSLLGDKLKLDAGFKEAIINRDGTNYLPGPQYKAVLNDSQPLPAISAHYQFDPRNQIFASVSTNFRSPVNTTLYNTYSYLDGSVANIGSSNVKDEYSISEELGYRYTGSELVASVSYFHYNFTNRQIATAVAGTNGSVTTSINAGGQTSDGINVELGTRPFHHFRPYVAGQYLHTSIDNDIDAGGDYLPTKGKDAVRSPHFVGSVGIDWDNGQFFWNWNMRYIGKQYSTFMNDEEIPAYYEMGGTVGVRLPDIGRAKSPTIQLNLVNLTDNHFLSGINSISTNALNTVGRFGSVIDGTAPTYNVGEGFAAIATVKVGF
ncbi:TonB-dependent receptor [Acetobacteraceae bacterium KSS8]|uniref:TonB-dependent receptor n=1 Tax=Endosaccharibacter trunci TaxID=2812733 RepID=A0ABT1W5D6_9PROT|nr:TonB-dependent receptor [Acetobacteraceae bacterium KSS8]